MQLLSPRTRYSKQISLLQYSNQLARNNHAADRKSEEAAREEGEENVTRKIPSRRISSCSSDLRGECASSTEIFFHQEEG